MPRLETLGLPEVVSELMLQRRGLLLLVGATGSGKSTTLAAMINHRNENASDHIVTIEDPIEFLHTNKRSLVNQRGWASTPGPTRARCAARCEPPPTRS